MIKVKPSGNAKSAGNDKPAKRINVTKLLPTFVRQLTGDVRKKRGRPATGKAMTSAQRQAKFKALRKALANG